MEKFIPRHKDDIASAQKLWEYDWDFIKPYVSELLPWMQDMNWPVAREIANFLRQYSSDLGKELVLVMRSNDDIWKYWCLRELIQHHPGLHADQHLLAEMTRISKRPSIGELEEGVKEAIDEILSGK